MKCENCGFNFDNEAVCPICGTPAAQPAAPVQDYRPAPPSPYFAQPAPIAETPAVQAASTQAPAKAPRESKGLKIAILCVLAVIAAALVYNAVIQTISFSRELRYEEELFGDGFDSFITDDDLDFDDDFYTAPQTFNDSQTHAIGEAFDFGQGTVSLKSAKVTGAASISDDAKQLVGFAIEIQNNTAVPQTYIEPYIELEDSVFDEENYRFTEFSDNTDSYEVTVKSGDSVTYTYYYALPKENQKLSCTLDVYGYLNEDESGNYSAHTTYEFEIKNIQ